MTDRPILFSAPMVRALLAGTKTQTRRLIKTQPKLAPHHEPVRVERRSEHRWVWMVCTDRPAYQFATGDWRSPIAEGDRLYVREHWNTDVRNNGIAPRNLATSEPVWYLADDGRMNVTEWALRSSQHRKAMHMPRWASRITLTVTNVRVERLQDICEEDALAEGIGTGDYPVDVYASLWNTINGPGSWEANPFVAAYTFTVALGNVDQIGRAA